MKTYSTEIIDTFGDTGQLYVSVDEVRQTGTLTWPTMTANLIKLSRASTNDRLQFSIKLTHIIIKNCYMYVVQSSTDYSIHINVGNGSSFFYVIEKESYGRFLEFIKNLQLPITTIEERLEITEIDVDITEVAALGLISVSLYVAWRPTSDIDMEFTHLIIDGDPIQNLNTYDLPADQGFFIPLGYYPKNKELLIAWQFGTDYMSLPAQIAVGVFRNNSLLDKTQLKKYHLESFETYTNAARVPV